MVGISSTPLKEKKAVVRAQEFQLKPITKILFDTPIMPPHYLSFLAWLADYCFSPLSFVFAAAFPPVRILLSPTFGKLHVQLRQKLSPSLSELRTGKQDLRPHSSREQTPKLSGGSDKKTAQKKNTKILIWGKNDELISEKIKKTISIEQNVLMLVPHETQLLLWSQQLSKKNKPPIVYKRNSGIKSWKETHERIAGAKGEVILGTPSAIFAPIDNVGLIVVMSEESPLYYHGMTKPYFNTVTAAKKLALIVNADIIMTSNSPSLEQYYEAKQNTITLVKEKAIDKIQPDIIDIRNNPKGIALSRQTLRQLQQLMSQDSGMAVIFINRRGHVSATICKDCGFTNMCSKCDVPYSLHTSNERQLVCHHCGARTPIPKLCPKCRSHNLDSYGTGIQKIVAELGKVFKNIPIIRFDSDAYKNLQEEKGAIEKLLKEKKAILVTTELFFKHELREKFDLGIIAHFDQAFFLPDYRIEEKMRRILVIMQNMSKKLIIQTYNPERDYLKNIQNMQNSYEEELNTRKALFYPPFSQIIRLVYRNKDAHNTITQAKLLERKLERFNIQKSPALPCFIPRKQNLHCMEMILRLTKPSSKEEIKKRNEVLRLVPSDWQIIVDPLDVL